MLIADCYSSIGIRCYSYFFLGGKIPTAIEPFTQISSRICPLSNHTAEEESVQGIFDLHPEGTIGGAPTVNI
jgi:hypothetical protein